MVLRFLKSLCPVLSLFVLGGCAALGALFPTNGGSSSSASTAAAPAAGSATLSVPSITDEVEPSTKLAVFSPAALLDGNSALDATIVNAQCRFRSADPPFLVPTTTANKSWTFTGRINEAAKGDNDYLGDAQALEYRSWFGFGWPKQQLNSWPLSMVMLSEMPQEYLDERLPLLSDQVLKDNKPQGDVLLHDFIENARQIQTRVQILVSSYDPGKCGTEK
jgi:hypothetical protein